MSFKCVFIGDIQNTSNSLKNYLMIFLGKFTFIYAAKTKPNMNGFLSFVKGKYEIKRYLALKRDKLKKFEKKWVIIKAKM